MSGKYKATGRVTYILPKREYFNQGGSGRVTHALGVVEGFSKNGWRVTVISGNGTLGCRSWVDAGTRLCEVAGGGGLVGRIIWPFRLLKEVFQHLSSERPNVVIVRYSITAYPFLMILCYLIRRRRSVAVLEVNSLLYHHIRAWSLVRSVVLRLEVFLVSRFDIAYVVSGSLGSLLNEVGCRSVIAVVPNGASSDRALSNLGEGDVREISRFVYLGSPHPYYDFDIVVQALSNVSHQGYGCELHFYGSGPTERELKDAYSGLANVFFHGRFYLDDVEALINQKTDVMVLPPKHKWDMELSGGLSTKLFEFMSFGVPMVAPEMGEVEAILFGGRNAVLYDPNQVEDLERAFIDCVEGNIDLDMIANNSYEAFLKYYTWRVRMSELIEYVEQCGSKRLEN